MQVEKLSNELLDSCDQFRESMGEVTDNVSLAVALETLWSERIENSSSGKSAAFKMPSCPELSGSRMFERMQKEFEVPVAPM